MLAVRRVALVVAGLAISSAALWAEDVAGLWTATFTPPDGHRHETTFDLQSDGGRISGKIFSKRGSVAITDGRIEGGKISFHVLRKGNGDEIDVVFTGTAGKETMKLHMQYGDRDPVPIIAKRSTNPGGVR